MKLRTRSVLCLLPLMLGCAESRVTTTRLPAATRAPSTNPIAPEIVCSGPKVTRLEFRVTARAPAAGRAETVSGTYVIEYKAGAVGGGTFEGLLNGDYGTSLAIQPAGTDKMRAGGFMGGAASPERRWPSWAIWNGGEPGDSVTCGDPQIK